MPRFSIIVPAYNAQATVAETLDAILHQTFDDWECVVVDDGSRDDTLAIASAYARHDSRFRVIHQDNGGSGGAYNAGVRAAVAEFIVICSADDILLPQHLASTAAFIDDEPGYDIYSTNGYFWGAEDVRELVYAPGERDEIASLTLSDVIRCCFYSVGATYRRELFEGVAGYREDVFGEDYDFWLRAMAGGARHRYNPKALSLHRVSATQKSASLEDAYRSDIRLVTDLRDAAPLSPGEIAAVEGCVRERWRLIGQIDAQTAPRTFRDRARVLLGALLGQERALRLRRRVSSLSRKGSSPRG